MILSRQSFRAWSAPSSSTFSFIATCASAAHNAPLNSNTYFTFTTAVNNNINAITYPSTSHFLSQKRGYASFKRYTMDQSLVNDLKSQPRDSLLFRNDKSKDQVPRKRTAYIALGSNMGDRVAMIEQACREMDARGIMVKRTSSLWETEPMYVLDQDRFVNGACEVGVS